MMKRRGLWQIVLYTLTVAALGKVFLFWGLPHSLGLVQAECAGTVLSSQDGKSQVMYIYHDMNYSGVFNVTGKMGTRVDLLVPVYAPNNAILRSESRLTQHGRIWAVFVGLLYAALTIPMWFVVKRIIQ